MQFTGLILFLFWIVVFVLIFPAAQAIVFCCTHCLTPRFFFLNTLDACVAMLHQLTVFSQVLLIVAFVSCFILLLLGRLFFMALWLCFFSFWHQVFFFCSLHGGAKQVDCCFFPPCHLCVVLCCYALVWPTQHFFPLLLAFAQVDC